jgi:hypothetical protein
MRLTYSITKRVWTNVDEVLSTQFGKPVPLREKNTVFRNTVYIFATANNMLVLAASDVLCTDGKEISQSSDIDDLKRHITEDVAAVTCDMLRRVWEELDY